LQDTSGNCLHDSVVGTFYNGVIAGSDTAYVELAVQVDTVGTYSISTDVQNGFSFADAGTFTSTGINIIKLKAVGTAAFPAITNFTVTFDSSVCYFSVNVKDSTGTGLGGGGGNSGGSTKDTSAAIGTWEFSTDSGYFHGNFNLAFIQDTLGNKYYTLTGTTAGTDSVFLFNLYL